MPSVAAPASRRAAHLPHLVGIFQLPVQVTTGPDYTLPAGIDFISILAERLYPAAEMRHSSDVAPGNDARRDTASQES
jgi:hypothetical protein